MKKLIEKEPITPFTDRVNGLVDMGISTILVIGGSGEYLAIADDIFMMDEFVMSEVTSTAKSLVPTPENPPAHDNWNNNRTLTKSFSTYPEGMTRELLSVSDTGFIVIGDERIDIRSLHDIAAESQVNALAFILRYLAKGEESMDSLERQALAIRGLIPKTKASHQEVDIVAKVQELYAQIEADGLNLVDTGFFTSMHRFMDLPRQFEVLAAINRMRRVEYMIYC